MRFDVCSNGRLGEARPPRARLEFSVGAEQFGSARLAPVHAIVVAVPVLAGERALGSLLSHDFVFQRRQLGTPLLFGLDDLAIRFRVSLSKLHGSLRPGS